MYSWAELKKEDLILSISHQARTATDYSDMARQNNHITSQFWNCLEPLSKQHIWWSWVLAFSQGLLQRENLNCWSSLSNQHSGQLDQRNQWSVLELRPHISVATASFSPKSKAYYVPSDGPLIGTSKNKWPQKAELTTIWTCSDTKLPHLYLTATACLSPSASAVQNLVAGACCIVNGDYPTSL